MKIFKYRNFDKIKVLGFIRTLITLKNYYIKNFNE